MDRGVSRRGTGSPVAHILGARAVRPDDDEDVLKVGPDALGSERQCSGLLEDNGHDVISYVPFPQELRAGQSTQTPLHTRLSAQTDLVGAHDEPVLQQREVI